MKNNPTCSDVVLYRQQLISNGIPSKHKTSFHVLTFKRRCAPKLYLKRNETNKETSYMESVQLELTGDPLKLSFPEKLTTKKRKKATCLN